MSTKYPGGIISKTAPTPSGPYSTDTAPGVWTLEQQAYWQKLGQWPTAGNANPSLFIENLFSTYLYTGTGSTQTITNGIDLSGEGGLVWIKKRTGSSVMAHYWTDTVRGISAGYISSNSTNAENTTQVCNAFNSNGFGYNPVVSDTGDLVASWTFREQAKFFDIVTYTGDGTANRQISHSLASVPGCIIVKATNDSGSWYTYHRSLGDYAANHPYAILLNSTGAKTAYSAFKGDPPTSTTFTVDGVAGAINASGTTYVAYLFAHDAGGFGTSGLENVISCGSYTGNGSSTGPTVNLGYEPQFIILKAAEGGTSGSQDWNMIDNMRGWTTSSNQQLNPNLTAAETSQNNIALNATGFQLTTAGADFNGSGNTYIYIAIRRGPMATPTVGTSVFAPTSVSAATGTVQTTNFPVDAQMLRYTADGYSTFFVDRLRGVSTTPANQASPYLVTNATNAESTGPNLTYGWNNTSFAISGSFNSLQMIYWSLRRAPGFFDEVCYTGTGASRNVSHNLTVIPELMIVKDRTSVRDWVVYSPTIGTSNTLYLNANNAQDSFSGWGGTPTSTTFALTSTDVVNASGNNYVAYLFATVAGVSKVGSYTGTGTTAQIDCGFTTGARFVLIKRTDSTGDWYVWDSARGIVAGNDPYLLLNSTAAEVTGTDYVDTYSAGFEISSTAPSAINANGGTFIFLAIA